MLDSDVNSLHAMTFNPHGHLQGRGCDYHQRPEEAARPQRLAQGSAALSGRVGMTGGTCSGPSGAPRPHQLAEGSSRPARAGGMVRQGNEGACREGPGVGPPKGQESAQALDKWS